MWFLLFSLLAQLTCHLMRTWQTASYVSAVIFLIFAMRLFREDWKFFVKYLHVWFTSLFFLCGLFVCEMYDVFLVELEEQSSYEGAFPLGAFYFTMVLCFIRFFDLKINCLADKGSVRLSRGLLEFLLAALFVLSVFVFASVARNPSFILGIERFAYAELLPAVVKKTADYLQFAVPVIIVVYVLNQDKWSVAKRAKVFGAIVPYALFLLWTGNKFGAFFFLFMYSVIPFVATKKWSWGGGRGLRICLCVLVAAFCFLSILFVQFASYDYNNEDSPAVRFLQRTAQQGQLWWRLFKDGTDCQIEEMLPDIFSSLTWKQDEGDVPDFGVYKLMNFYAPDSVVNGMFDYGCRYSTQGLELSYYYMGIVGLILRSILIAVGFVVLINLYCSCIKNNLIICSFVTLRFVQFFMILGSQGQYNLFISFGNVLWVVVAATEMLYCWTNGRLLMRKD